MSSDIGKQEETADGKLQRQCGAATVEIRELQCVHGGAFVSRTRPFSHSPPPHKTILSFCLHETDR